MSLKDKIAAVCTGCKYAVPHKMMEGRLIHLDLFATREAGTIGNCVANDLLLPHVIHTDTYDNPVFAEEAASAINELEAELIAAEEENERAADKSQ